MRVWDVKGLKAREGSVSLQTPTHDSIIPEFFPSARYAIIKSEDIDTLKKYLQGHPGGLDEPDPSTGCTPLMEACAAGSLKTVKYLVSRGANVNFCGHGKTSFGLHYTITPLYCAIEGGFVDVVRYLIQKNVDVNFPCSGKSALLWAILRHNDTLAEILVVSGRAKVSIPSEEANLNYPVLMAICEENKVLLAVLLSADDFDPNVKDRTENVTPLHMAAYSEDTFAVEQLLLAGANVNAELTCGHTPLDIAEQWGYDVIADMIKALGGNRNVMEEKPWVPYSLLAVRRFLDIKKAFDRGVNVNTPIAMRITPLLVACGCGNIPVATYLLDRGAEPMMTDSYGNSALHYAAHSGLEELVFLLLERGADINVKNNIGFTPLHVAADRDHGKLITRLMMEANPKPEIDAEAGAKSTPLFVAAVIGNCEAAVALLLHGANPHVKVMTSGTDDDFSETSVLHGVCMNSPESHLLIKALVENGANVNEPHHSERQGTLYPLHLLIVNGHGHNIAASIKCLIESGAYLDAEANSGPGLTLMFGDAVTPLEFAQADVCRDPVSSLLLKSTVELFKAVRKNDFAAAERFRKEGGLVNCCMRKFYSPLIYASWKGFTAMVKFFLKHGVDVSRNNPLNAAALHYAARYGHAEIAELLLRAGADPGHEIDGKTPLDLATSGGHARAAAVIASSSRWR